MVEAVCVWLGSTGKVGFVGCVRFGKTENKANLEKRSRTNLRDPLHAVIRELCSTRCGRCVLSAQTSPHSYTALTEAREHPTGFHKARIFSFGVSWAQTLSSLPWGTHSSQGTAQSLSAALLPQRRCVYRAPALVSSCKKEVLATTERSSAWTDIPEGILLGATGRHLSWERWEGKGKAYKEMEVFTDIGDQLQRSSFLFLIICLQRVVISPVVAPISLKFFEISGNYFWINRKNWLLTPGRMTKWENIFNKNLN